LSSGSAWRLTRWAVNDLVSHPPFREEGGDQLRRILEVCIEDNDRLSSALREPRGYRGLVSEISCKVYHGNSGVRGGGRVEQRRAPVPTAVIDEDDLK
jgi:hypothetical protein